MIVTFGRRQISFRPWRPQDGRVFQRRFALDTETTRIDEQRPWLTPAYVLGAACDGQWGVFVHRRHVREFLRQHEGTEVVFHNAPFDLAVLHLLVPELDLYRWVDQDRAWDTQLLHRLYLLAKEGHTAARKGESTLEHCSELYLGEEIPKDLRDSNGDVVRLSYGKWLSQPCWGT
jgi:hypothetical protein